MIPDPPLLVCNAALVVVKVINAVAPHQRVARLVLEAEALGLEALGVDFALQAGPLRREGLRRRTAGVVRVVEVLDYGLARA